MDYKLIVITYESHPDLYLKGFLGLEHSLKKHGLEYEVVGSKRSWDGFGCKLLETYKALLKYRDSHTHFIFVDSRDTYFLGVPDMSKYKFLISAEKNCWPDSNRAEAYPTTFTPWKFVNSGTYGGEIRYTIEMFQHFGLDKVAEWADDQRELTTMYLEAHEENLNVELDTKCQMFQSIAFEVDGDFDYGDKFTNKITGTQPLVLHSNGNWEDIKKIHNLYW